MKISRKIYKDWMKETQIEKLNSIIKAAKPKGKILDVGAGPGFLSHLIENVVSVDIDEENLKFARGETVIASGDKLPFQDKSFDYVFCIDTVHLLKNPHELIRVLKSNGKLVVSTFCNEGNYKEKIKWLKSLYPGVTIEMETMVTAKKENDAVLIIKRK